MRITIEGDQAQIRAACKQIVKAIPRPVLTGPTERMKLLRARRNAREIRDHQHRLVHRAFLLTRNDPSQAGIAKEFLAALTGKSKIDDALVLAAESIANAEARTQATLNQ